VRRRGAECVAEKPLPDHSRPDEPNHECVGTGLRQTDDNGKAVGQSACEQAGPRRRLIKKNASTSRDRTDTDIDDLKRASQASSR
jgi:hypothetical protein